MSLTVKGIEKLHQPGRYLDERGLYLQVRSANSKSWLLRYEREGKEHYLGLGSLAEFSLDEARERARKAKQLLRDGRDPIAEKRRAADIARADQARSAARTKTFGEAAEEYFDQHQSKWSNRKHRAQFLSTLRQYAYPVIGRLNVDQVDRELILKILDPIWKKKPETANRIRGRIEAVLNFSAFRGYRSGENPARWKGHLDQALVCKTRVRDVTHFRALPYAEVPKFLSELRRKKGTAARAMEFLVLTAARTSEVTGALWEEFDLTNKIWTIPSSRMKARRPHRVPLSEAAIAVLKRLYQETGNPYVFVGARKKCLSNMAMDKILRSMGLKAKATVHGFRSSFRDWVAEATDFPNHVAEAALAHIVGDKVEAAYRRSDLFEKRSHLMTAWACYCLSGDSAQRNPPAKRAA